jgi:LAO/AO transport system kinase
MQAHATDPGVFIRSLGTRGASGGLSVSTAHVIAALGAGGFGTVLVETVGVGQAEIDVATTADVAVVVMVPGLGDDIQALKAGLLEIADVLVVNKADRAGADQAIADLQGMLALRRITGARTDEVAIVRVVATTGAGIDELLGAIEAARGAPTEERRRRKAERRVTQLLIARVTADARRALNPGGLAVDLVGEVAAGRMDPKSAVQALMDRLRGGY